MVELLSYDPFRDLNEPLDSEMVADRNNLTANNDSEASAIEAVDPIDPRSSTERDWTTHMKKENQPFVVLRSDHGVTALVGDRRIREGGVTNGVRVLSIQAERLLLSIESESQPSDRSTKIGADSW